MYLKCAKLIFRLLFCLQNLEFVRCAARFVIYRTFEKKKKWEYATDSEHSQVPLYGNMDRRQCERLWHSWFYSLNGATTHVMIINFHICHFVNWNSLSVPLNVVVWCCQGTFSLALFTKNYLAWFVFGKLRDKWKSVNCFKKGIVYHLHPQWFLNWF